MAKNVLKPCVTLTLLPLIPNDPQPSVAHDEVMAMLDAEIAELSKAAA